MTFDQSSDISNSTPDADVHASGEPRADEPQAMRDAPLGETPSQEPLGSAEASVGIGSAEEHAEEQVREPVEEVYVERPPVEIAEPEAAVERNWYILKVQSNREESIKDGLLRRVKVAGLDEYFGDVIVPTETVTEFKNGKKRVVKRKLYPGYIVVNMAITDETWFVVRETPGIGDFTGAAGKPSPMRQDEIDKLTRKEKAAETEAPTLSIAFRPGDRVKINDGTFENFEGDVSAVDAANGRITVMINIFGRSTPVELEYWQVEGV
jgi:transcription termination/antitermination protein NusG